MMMLGAWFLLLGAPGCRDVQNLSSAENVPLGAQVTELEMKRVDFDRADAVFVLGVDNPLPDKVRVSSKTWSLKLAGRDFREGKSGQGARLAARSRSTVRIPVAVRWQDAIQVGEVKAGEQTVPYVLEATIGLETPTGEVTVPVRHEGTLTVLHRPRILLDRLVFLGLEGADQFANLALDLELGTDQGTPLTFDPITYRLLIDGIPVGSGRLSKDNVGERSTLTIPLKLGLFQMPAAVVTAIRMRRGVDMRLTATSRIATPHGVLTFEVDEKRSMPLE